VARACAFCLVLGSAFEYQLFLQKSYTSFDYLFALKVVAWGYGAVSKHVEVFTWLFQCGDCPDGCLTMLRPRYAPQPGIATAFRVNSKLGCKKIQTGFSTFDPDNVESGCFSCFSMRVLSDDQNSGSIGACLAILHSGSRACAFCLDFFCR